MMLRSGLAALLFVSLAAALDASQSDELPVVKPVRFTAPLYNDEDAPAAPDADDPAIWVNTRHPERSLVMACGRDRIVGHHALTWRSCPTADAIASVSIGSIPRTRTARSWTSRRRTCPGR